MGLKSFLRPIKHALIGCYDYCRYRANQRRELAFLNKLIGRDKLVFDIGANIGAKTELFRKLGHKVIALEPQDYCYQILKQKFSLDNQVIALKKGVGSEKGELELNVSSVYRGFSSFIPDWQKGTKYYTSDKKEKAEITTLDNLIDEYGLPFYCKIDVEGYELEVLNGLKYKIPYLNFEYHGDNFDSTIKCLDKLEIIGYKSFNYVIYEGNFALNKWVDKKLLIKNINEKIKNNLKIWGDIYAK